jgi:hypothetical protein
MCKRYYREFISSRESVLKIRTCTGTRSGSYVKEGKNTSGASTEVDLIISRSVSGVQYQYKDKRHP